MVYALVPGKSMLCGTSIAYNTYMLYFIAYAVVPGMSMLCDTSTVYICYTLSPMIYALVPGMSLLCVPTGQHHVGCFSSISCSAYQLIRWMVARSRPASTHYLPVATQP